jgi:transposase
MRPKGTVKELQRRRERAIAVLKDGCGIREVARMVGSCGSSVVRWRDAHEKGGAKALEPKPTPGRPRKLSDKQRQKLDHLLNRGPTAFGYKTNLWTLERIAAVIRRKFRVCYHPFPRGFNLVMDRWMVHRSGAKRLQKRFSRVDVEWLPPYAPDLNPVEQVWNGSKYTDLANYIPEDIGELEKEVCKSINHIRSQQSVLRSFFKKAKLKL